MDKYRERTQGQGSSPCKGTWCERAWGTPVRRQAACGEVAGCDRSRAAGGHCRPFSRGSLHEAQNIERDLTDCFLNSKDGI